MCFDEKLRDSYVADLVASIMDFQTPGEALQRKHEDFQNMKFMSILFNFLWTSLAFLDNDRIRV